MIKTIVKLLFIFALIPFITGCEDAVEGFAVITFDPNSTRQIPDDGTVWVSGTVEISSGIEIEYIRIVCVFLEKITVDPELPPVHYEVFTGNGMELVKISENKYKFTVTHENSLMNNQLTNTRAIRVNTLLKNRERNSKTWYMRAQYKR